MTPHQLILPPAEKWEVRNWISQTKNALADRMDGIDDPFLYLTFASVGSNGITIGSSLVTATVLPVALSALAFFGSIGLLYGAVIARADIRQVKAAIRDISTDLDMLNNRLQ